MKRCTTCLLYTSDGGITTLLREFSDFYNPAKTPNDADITPLLEMCIRDRNKILLKFKVPFSAPWTAGYGGRACAPASDVSPPASFPSLV